jgi:hypothetical protein
MINFHKLCKELEEQIIKIYDEGISLEEAERLAARFLYAQLQVSTELKTADLNARMRKSGTKAVRASAYTEACRGADKKPTEAALSAMLDTNELVSKQQDELDKAEVTRDELERYYDIFLNAHIYLRGVAKGRFE